MLKKFLTTDEISNDYGLTADTIQSLVDSGDLKALADRGTWKYRREDIESLIKAGHLHPTKELPVVDEDDIDLDDMFGISTVGQPAAAADFLELDEEALAEQPTIIRGDFPFDDEPVEAVEAGSDDFVDLHSDDVVDLQSHDLVDVQSDDVVDVQSDDFVDVQADEPTMTTESDSDVNVIFEPPTLGTFSDSDIRLSSGEPFAAPMATAFPGDGSDSDVTTAPDSETLESDRGGQTEEIAIDEFDESNQLDVLEQAARSDEAGSLETLADMPTDWQDQEGDAFAMLAADDSGISLDDDSGITLDADDSGISLDAGDSGISLDVGDSGISLDAGDSGIRLADSGTNYAAAVDPLGKTENDLALHFDDDAPPVLDAMDQTTELSAGDSADAFAPTFSGVVEAGEEVEDLEVSADLDEDAASEEIFADEELEDEIAEVDDETFSEEYGETGDDDEELAAAPGKKASREPGWGMPTFVLALSATLLVLANVWLAWSGLQTMWDGSDPPGPAASLVTTISGLM